VGALQTLRSYPDLLCRFGEKQRAYTLGIYRPPPPQCSPARLVTQDSTAPYVRRRPQEWPPVFDTQVNILDGYTLEIVQGTQVMQQNFVRNDSLITLVWPTLSGIGGALKCDDWESVTAVQIHAEPYGYPFALLAEQLILRDDVQAVLDRADAWVSFVDTPSAPRKIALLLAALGLQNTSVYGNS
jgi:hypothetical protein